MCPPLLAAIAAAPVASAALGLGAVSTGVQIIGQQLQIKQASDEAAYKNAVLANQGTVINQDIKHEQQQQLVRDQIIAEETLQAEGLAKVRFAGLGQQLSPGSAAADRGTEIREAGAFREKVNQADSLRRIRNFNIQRGNLSAEAGLNTLRAEGTASTLRARQFGTVLTGLTNIGTTFKFKGGFGFRTRGIE